MARASVRKIKPRDKTFELLLGELVGGTPPEDHSNIATLMNVRRGMYSAARNFVAETVRLSLDMPELELVDESARLREMLHEMFADQGFLSEETLTGDRATEFKRNYLDTKKHPLAQTILEYTSVLTKLRIMPPSSIDADELEQQNFRLTRQPIALLGKPDLLGPNPGAPRFKGLCERLPKLTKLGVDFYNASLEPEIDFERMIEIVSVIVPTLAKNTHSCKNAIGAISRAKDILRTNIRKYMRLVTVRNSPIALFEGLLEDIKEDAMQSDLSNKMATARELSSVLREIRSRFGLNKSAPDSQASKIARVMDMAEDYLDKLNESMDNPEEQLALAQESVSSFASLIRAVSEE